jgi:hypothetical protein
MSASTDAASPPAAQAAAPKPGAWERLKGVLVRTEAEFAFFKGLTFLGVIGSLIATYFQYVGNYHDKVNAQAQKDLEVAMAAFTDTSGALQTPLLLQERLVFSFYDAVASGADLDDNAYVTKKARALAPDYEKAESTFRQNVNLLARKVEINLDLPSDVGRDAASNTAPSPDPLNTAALGEYEYDCDAGPPRFNAPAQKIPHPKDHNKPALIVNWLSAKHIVFVTYYCFHIIQSLMEPARQWGAGGAPSTLAADVAARGEFIKDEKKIETKLTNQVLRLNAFMSVAMYDIDKIHIKYRPNGVMCNLPVVREIIGIVSSRCTPIHEERWF